MPGICPGGDGVKERALIPGGLRLCPWWTTGLHDRTLVYWQMAEVEHLGGLLESGALPGIAPAFRRHAPPTHHSEALARLIGLAA